MNKQKPHISIAPMMDWTDRHCRYFHRLISPNAYLYTEMVTTGAILHGDRERFLRFDPKEHPVALQLGGSNPEDLATCAKIGEDQGYDEINLNCGCPSDRVQSGFFGACLMVDPATVAKCISAMIKAVTIPVTVKCRIGIDDHDSFEFLDTFISAIKETSCKTFIIHARKAHLKGLSPKENRTVPPLNYERVTEIKNKHPDLNIILNGGITTIEDIKAHLQTLDGVMIGREAYQNPYILSKIESEIFENRNILTRDEIARTMMLYIKNQRNQFETPVKSITRHMIGLFQHEKGARQWRRTLSILPHKDDADETVIEQALSAKNL